MFAVIRTGGKQYKVTSGDTIAVEKLDGAHTIFAVTEGVVQFRERANGKMFVSVVQAA
mgnify:CR=1 FL=1